MRKYLLALCMVCFAGMTYAEDFKLTVPEMKPELVKPEPLSLTRNMNALPKMAPSFKPDFDFFKSKTNPGVKPYKFMDDMTFVGVPLFLAGWAIKGDKAMFRVNAKADQGGKSNTQLLTDFKTGIDDYTQFFGPAMTVGLKLGGYEGRSDWPRLLASAGMSYGIMAVLVNGIKYTAKEMRPDGSTANSWPSGHTATSFVGATLLHKEYGLTRSPWFSVAGYGVATATGIMRVLNNRHWVSDVMSGAGIGIISTELGYAIGDALFKGKGLLRNDMMLENENPSFFSISMGAGIGSKSIDFNVYDMMDEEEIDPDYLEYYDGHEQIKFRSATVVDAEGAYFFNKYVGVGGRLRVRAMSAKSFGSYSENIQVEDLALWDGVRERYAAKIPNDGNGDREEDFTFIDSGDGYIIPVYAKYYANMGFDFSSEDAYMANAPVTDIYGTVKSDHLAEFTGSVGLYFNLPLSKYFSIGTKALIGRSFTQELDIDGHAEGNVKDIKYTIIQENKNGISNKDIQSLQYPENTGEKWSDDWDYLTVGAKSSTSFGTGISLTYKYKSNFSWRLYCDYDYTKKDFTLKYDPFHFAKKALTPAAYEFMQVASDYSENFNPTEYKKTKKMNYFTVGIAFLVNL